MGPRCDAVLGVRTDVPLTLRPPALPLTPALFERALRTGQGRAMAMVREHGVAGLEEPLLHACAWNPVFDAQCEDPRAAWIVEMVATGVLGPRALDAIAEAEAEASPDTTLWDRLHRAAVLMELAERGVPGARSALYRMLSRQPGTSDVVGAEAIVDLDGDVGLVAVTRRMGEWLAEDPQFWASDEILYAFDAREGEGAALRVLHRVREQEPSVERFLACLEAREREEPPTGERRIPRTQTMSAADVIALIRSDPPDRCLWLSGFRPQDTHQRELLFDALLAESEPERALRFLRVFVRHGPPRFDERLLHWADSPLDDLSELATRVLSNVSHPRVRELAIARLAAGTAARGTIRLLRNTFEAGDHAWIEAALRPEGQDSDVHGHLMDVLDVFEANPVPEAVHSLSFVAEHTRCSHCRMTAVRVLLEMDALPEWMRAEARVDGSERVRELVEDADAS